MYLNQGPYNKDTGISLTDCHQEEGYPFRRCIRERGNVNAIRRHANVGGVIHLVVVLSWSGARVVLVIRVSIGSSFKRRP